MAINIKNWVDITSNTLPESTNDRELILRLITKSNRINANKVYEMTTLADVANTFLSSSDEYKIAEKYFSFVSINATKPEKISFWRPGKHEVKGESGEISFADDDTTTTLNIMEQASDNFATFFFVNRSDFNENTTDSSGKNVFQTAANWAASRNYKFRYVVPVQINNIAQETGTISWNENSTVESYLKPYRQPCVTMVLDDAFVNGTSTYPEWLTCALLASTKYNRSNSTIIQEFKALNSSLMTVTCSCDELFNILTKYNVNFFGRTMKAGKTIDFYMEGYNGDGTDTSVGDNEIWLKDRLITEVFDRFTKTNKIPAGAIGMAMIKSAMTAVISEGLNNLAIQTEKTISEADKAAIIQNTGATDAPAHIYTTGYYLSLSEATKTVGSARRRIVDYIFYYSTGEGIRKVTGSNIMV